jgi:hypothetical protein
MSERSVVQTIPRRDGDGRVLRLPEFVGVALGYTVVNGVGLAVIDAVVALLGSGFGGSGQASTIGRSPGWLMLILPGLLFFDDLRAWRGHGVRFLVAIVAAVVAIGVGLIVAGLVRGLPPILSGGLGALVAVLLYAPIWFLGVRYLTGDNPHAEST